MRFPRKKQETYVAAAKRLNQKKKSQILWAHYRLSLCSKETPGEENGKTSGHTLVPVALLHETYASFTWKFDSQVG